MLGKKNCLGKIIPESVKGKISKALKGKKLSDLHKKNLSKSLKGKKKSIQHRANLSIAFKGKTPWNKGIKYIKIRKEKHWNWKGGISPIHKIIRRSIEYKIWREAVFLRDNYTCVFCGKRGGILNADHIKPFVYFPELRFAIDNGRTLCVPCHKKTDTYAGKINKYNASINQETGGGNTEQEQV